MPQLAKFSPVRAGLAAVLAVFSFSSMAQAAVRSCTARLTSTVSKDATENGAKKKAISDWMVKAKAAGVAHPAWRLAAERTLKCLPSAGAGGSPPKPGFECVAVGHACTVEQVAPTPSPKASPTRGFGVDT